MDRHSHIAFAKGLLKIAGERTDMAYMSILPLVDGEPSFLHRLHSHPLVKGPVIVDSAKVVFGSSNGVVPNIPEDTFELVRFREEYYDFINTFNETLLVSGEENMMVDEGYGSLLSVISHSYFDTYNNAVQAFAPYESYCAGQWDMWNKVDYFNYRIKWYRQTAPEFRKLVLSEPLWDVSFTAKELVKGMIHRVAAHTKPDVKPESIVSIEKDLGVDDLPFNTEVEAFYLKLEEAVKRHLIESVSESVSTN